MSNKIDKPELTLYWAAWDGEDILHIGETEPSQVTETTLTLYSFTSREGLIEWLESHKDKLVGRDLDYVVIDDVVTYIGE